MVRLIGGVLAGFIIWLFAWFAGEILLTAVWPSGFGLQHSGFQAALENGSPFIAETSFLVTHVVLAAMVSLLAGCMTARITRDDKRAVLALAILLTALGLMKAAMSWTLVPVWYHIVFTGLLMTMTLVGGMRRR
jgi:hypothetical protein